MQSNPPKSKWNPTRGPSWHSAPTASGQAPRFYVHCALYGSSYIPKYQSFPQTPCQGWNPNLFSLPSIQQHLLSQGFFFLTSALLPPLTCLAWPGQEMHLHFHIKKGATSSRAQVKRWLDHMPSCQWIKKSQSWLKKWLKKWPMNVRAILGVNKSNINNLLIIVNYVLLLDHLESDYKL